MNWLKAGMPNEDHVRRVLAQTAEQDVLFYIEASARYLEGRVTDDAPKKEDLHDSVFDIMRASASFGMRFG